MRNTLLGLIRDCLFEGNTVSSHGAAAFFSGVLMERCRIEKNVADSQGGGLYVGSASAVVRDCLIVDNISGANGGGVRIEGGGTLLTGCTIANNVAITGGGINTGPNSTSIENCILWGNSANGGRGQQFWQAAFGAASLSAALRFCNIEGGVDELEGGPGGPILYNTTNIIDEDPAFADQSNGDYSLTADSPCVDAGDPLFVADINEGDIENQPRVNGTVDIGSDEYWGGLALSLVSPGRAGEVNTISAQGAAPGVPVFFFVGLEAGETTYSFSGCPTLALGMDNAVFLGSRLANQQGKAHYSQLVSPELAGATILLQVIAFGPPEAHAGCTVSNLVQFRYF